MPFYAVGFGTWAQHLYRDATDEEKQKWCADNPGKEPKELVVRTACIDGSSAKAAGPFKTPKQAWDAAMELQKGAGMMADWPFIFEACPTIKLSTVIRKVESIGCWGEEMKVISEYDDYLKKRTSGGVHKVRLKREFNEDKDNQGWFENYRKPVPSSLNARRKLKNKLNRLRIDSLGY